MKLTLQEFQRLKDGSPVELFYQGLKSDETKRSYTRKLRYILCHTLEEILEGSFEERATQLVQHAKKDPEWVRDLLLNLSKKVRERTELPKDHRDYLNPSSVPNQFKPIKKLMEMNGIAFSWKRVYSTFPELDNLSDTRGWTRDEIQKMLNYSRGSIDRAIILVAASSGIRLGGFDLNWGDISPVYRVDGKLQFDYSEPDLEKTELACAMLKIYRGTPWEYPAFITPEAYSALLDYKIQWATGAGRQPKPDEPIFKKRGRKIKRVIPEYIKRRLEVIVEYAGLRNKLKHDKRRHDVPITNGFRRFWNKSCKESSTNDALSSLIKKEYMMGHVGLVKLDRNYFKTHVLELAEEYCKVIPVLTISNDFRLLLENRNLKNQIALKNSRVSRLIEEIKKDPEKFETILTQMS